VRTGELQTWRQGLDSAFIYVVSWKTVNYVLLNLHFPHIYLVFFKIHLLSSEQGLRCTLPV
jgi:hypothetical protein